MSILSHPQFAQPNYQFLHQELVALTSFPRQALTSILYEAGPASLSHHHLRSSDSMLMGTWVKFVLGLFVQAKPGYDWENSLGLFLNVVNGALLLYSEDLSILRQTLAALIVVASKFVNVFRKHGYEMVAPTLIQVYASHMSNKLITNALEFVWAQFYMLNLDSNVFVLQAIAATATLLSEEVKPLHYTMYIVTSINVTMYVVTSINVTMYVVTSINRHRNCRLQVAPHSALFSSPSS